MKTAQDSTDFCAFLLRICVQSGNYHEFWLQGRILGLDKSDLIHAFILLPTDKQALHFDKMSRSFRSGNRKSSIYRWINWVHIRYGSYLFPALCRFVLG